MSAPRTSAAPPAQELGYVAQATPGWGYFTGNSSSQMGDPLEDVPELRWPRAPRTFHKMRTDTQVDALIRAVMMPMLRLHWRINPNGARPEVVDDISSQLNLPIKGQEDSFVLRGRKRFNHAEHLYNCILAPTVYGSAFFEMVGDIVVNPDDPAEHLKWKLKKLAPRSLFTIANMSIARDGGLNSITQYDGTNWQGITIPISQLALYPWEKEGANWLGRSMLRPLYKYWVLKDRMLRIDALKNERYGLGVPVGTAAPGGDPNAMGKLASQVRAGDHSGVGLPNGASLGLQGISGTLPDTLASIQMYNEEMATAWLAMFMKLGTTKTGSRALGDSFVDLFDDSLSGFANWYKGITNEHVIEDIVDWNWGEDEQAPLLEWYRRDEEPLGVEDLANLIKSGALVVDEELENWIRKRYSMPLYTGGAPLPTKPATAMQDPQAQGAEEGADAPPDPTTADPATTPAVHAGGKSSKGTPADKRLKENKPKPKITKAGGKPGTGTPKDKRLKENKLKITKAMAEDQPRDEHGKWTVATEDEPRVTIRFLGSRGCDGHHATPGEPDAILAAAQTATNNTVGHRQPTAVEVKAATDFKKLQEQWTKETADIVSAWGDVRAKQIDALVAAVEKAVEDDDLEALANLPAPVEGAELIEQHMVAMATQAIEDASAEAEAQGVAKADIPDVDVADLLLDKRANAVASLMARDLVGSASRQAILRYGANGEPSEIAAGVREQLNNLTDAYLNDTLGGAMTQAQNAGRRAVIQGASNSATELYSSELMDQNTCENCTAVDGTEYASLDDAEGAYPAGGYVDCLGGPRCRGTIIAVYGESD